MGTYNISYHYLHIKIYQKIHLSIDPILNSLNYNMGLYDVDARLRITQNSQKLDYTYDIDTSFLAPPILGGGYSL